MAEDAAFGNRPQCRLRAGTFQGIVRPSVAGVKEVVAAFRFVEGVAFAVMDVGGNGDGAAVPPFQAAADVGGKFEVLAAADGKFGAAAAVFHAVVVGGVDGRFAEARYGFQGGGCGQVGPSRRVEVEVFVAPADGDPVGTLAARGVGSGKGGCPVGVAAAGRHDDVGVDAVGNQVEGDVGVAVDLPVAFNHGQQENGGYVGNQKEE